MNPTTIFCRLSPPFDFMHASNAFFLKTEEKLGGIFHSHHLSLIENKIEERWMKSRRWGGDETINDLRFDYRISLAVRFGGVWILTIALVCKGFLRKSFETSGAECIFIDINGNSIHHCRFNMRGKKFSTPKAAEEKRCTDERWMNFRFGFCAVSVRVNGDNFASSRGKKSGNDANEWEKEKRRKLCEWREKNSFKIKGTWFVCEYAMVKKIHSRFSSFYRLTGKLPARVRLHSSLPNFPCSQLDRVPHFPCATNRSTIVSARQSFFFFSLPEKFSCEETRKSRTIIDKSSGYTIWCSPINGANWEEEKKRATWKL